MRSSSEGDSYAIDYDGIVNDIFGGYAEKADSFISSTIWGYKAVGGVGEYDPEKAAECLKEAGYENGEGLPELNIYTSVGFYPKTKEYYEYIAACLQAVGINCKVVPLDTSSWGDVLYEETPCYMIDCGWQPSGIEPELKLNSWYAAGRISHYELRQSFRTSWTDSQLRQTQIRESRSFRTSTFRPWQRRCLISLSSSP